MDIEICHRLIMYGAAKLQMGDGGSGVVELEQAFWYRSILAQQGLLGSLSVSSVCRWCRQPFTWSQTPKSYDDAVGDLATMLCERYCSNHPEPPWTPGHVTLQHRFPIY